MKSFRIAVAIAATSLPFLGCDDSTSVPASDPGKTGDIYVLGQKYGPKGGSSLDRIRDGAISAIELEALPIHSNTSISADSDLVFLFDREAGVATAFAGGDPSHVVLDENVGGSSNPYDAAVVGGTVWVARYGSASLVGLSRATGKAIDSIDLSAYNDTGASVPNMIAAVRWNGKLVVPAERLTARYAAVDSSVILVIDPASHRVEKRIALPFRNVYDVSLRGDLLAAGCTGGWGSTTDGGLSIVDLAAGRVTRTFASTDLGGDPSKVEFTGDATVWVAVDLVYPLSKARTLDLATGKVGAYFNGADAVGDLAFDGRSLWIANHDDAAPFVYSVDPVTGSQRGVVRSTLAPGVLAVLK